MKILKMGILKENVRGMRPISLTDPEVSRLLNIEKLPNEHISLTMHEASEWQDLVFGNQPEGR